MLYWIDHVGSGQLLVTKHPKFDSVKLRKTVENQKHYEK